MKVSTVICSYSLERFIDTINVIKSLLDQSYPSVEIVVSIDHNEKLLNKLQKSLPVNILFAYNDRAQGLSDTRNSGVKASTGDIIAFIDDDAIADRYWVQSLIGNYSDQDVVAVGGKLIPLWESKRPWWFPEELDWVVGCTYKGHAEERTEVRNLIGCNMSFRREVFERVGQFSTAVGRLNKVPLAGEETEFCIRIKNYFPDKKIIYDPTAVVYHKVAKYRESLGYILKRSYGEGISKKNIRNALLSKDMLSQENSYLKHLLLTALPKYTSNALLLKKPVINIGQAFVILGAVFATGYGYIKT